MLSKVDGNNSDGEEAITTVNTEIEGPERDKVENESISASTK